MNTAPTLDSADLGGSGRNASSLAPRHDPHGSAIYGALDLGTNNCRLLIAKPSHDGFRIIDSFSRIVRLGENLALSGRLGEAAIARTLDALAVCRDKLGARGVSRRLLIATEACRSAVNGADFVARVAHDLGMQLTIVDRETEAGLAAAGCAALADDSAESVLLFDIGGGSSELVWLGSGSATSPEAIKQRIRVWTSLSLGVVTLADRFGGRDVTPDLFEAMVSFVSLALTDFIAAASGHPRCSRFHLLGTSGTVTTVAGVFLGLQRYDRRRVDGLWMSEADVTRAMTQLRGMPFGARVAHGCIGPDRADLVLAGCAILEAIRRAFPCERLRIADRGLREGILLRMMSRDNAWARLPRPRQHW